MLGDAAAATSRQLVQYFAHFGGKIRLTDWFLKQFTSFLDSPLVDYGIAGIACHVNDPKVRANLTRGLDEIAAVLPRHHNIGQQEIDPASVTEDSKCSIGARSAQNAVAQFPEQLTDILAQKAIVFRNQYGFTVFAFTWILFGVARLFC